MNTTLHGRNEGRLLLLAVRCLMSRFVVVYVVILQIKSNLEVASVSRQKQHVLLRAAVVIYCIRSTRVLLTKKGKREKGI
jgi:hypothetical protein